MTSQLYELTKIAQKRKACSKSAIGFMHMHGKL